MHMSLFCIEAAYARTDPGQASCTRPAKIKAEFALPLIHTESELVGILRLACLFFFREDFRDFKSFYN